MGGGVGEKKEGRERMEGNKEGEERRVEEREREREYSGTSKQGTYWGQYKLSVLSFTERLYILIQRLFNVHVINNKKVLNKTTSNVLYRGVHYTVTYYGDSTIRGSPDCLHIP